MNKLVDQKAEYDLVVSLGGSCAAAGQLLAREMRKFSLPFDYLYSYSVRPLESLARQFKTDFSRWLLPENVRECPVDKMRPGASEYQYFDEETGYLFAHQFLRHADADHINEVRQRSLRDIRKLCEKMSMARSVALCFDADFDGDVESAILTLRESLLEKFGADKRVDCYIWRFNAKRFGVERRENLTVWSFTHPRHPYVFSTVPIYEFSEMDGWSVTDCLASEMKFKGSWFYFRRNAHGWRCWLARKKRRIGDLTFRFGKRKYEILVGGR